MRKRISIFSMALLLSGCAGSTEISYIGDTSTYDASGSEQVTEAETTKLDDSDLDGTVWEKVIQVEKDGEKYEFSVKAVISAEYRDMPIYEYEIINQITPDQKCQMMTSLFDKDAWYYYDEEHYTKDMWQSQIDVYDNIIAGIDGDDEYKQFCEQQIDILMQKYQAAPDKLVPAEDGNANMYFGYINGLPYTIDFSFDSISDESIKRAHDMDPNALMLENVNMIVLSAVITMDTDKWENSEKMTEEELQGLVEKMYKAMGQNGRLGEAVKWDYFDNSYKLIQDEKSFNSGVIYSYTKEIQDKDGENVEVIICRGGNGGVVNCIKGRVEIAIYNPYNCIDKKDTTGLLPFEKIQESIVEEFSNNPDYYKSIYRTIAQQNYTTYKASYDKLELSYIEMADESGNKISKIPCWRLCMNDSSDINYVTMFVNAIDGSIIKPKFKVYGESVEMYPTSSGRLNY